MLKLRKALLCNYLYYLILFLALVYFLISTILIKYKSSYSLDTTNIFGKIISYTFDGDKLNVIIKTPEKVKVIYRITSLEEKEYLINEVKYDSYLTISGETELPINNTIPNTFNYKKYLYHQKIYYLFNAFSIKIDNDQIGFFNKLKNSLKERIGKYEKEDYLLTFILGDSSLINNEISSNYRNLGVSHLFAISGMHVSLFTIILLFILKKLRICENKRYFIIFILLFFYAFITNYTPSVMRATIFFFYLSLNKIFYTEIKTLNIFILTISTLIFINPFIVYDLGCQYSLITSLGLLLFNSKLNSKYYLISLLKVSFIAFLFSLPITAINFYEINILSVFFNLIFVPLITFIVYPFSLIILFLPFLEPVFNLLINILEKVSIFTNQFSLMVIIPKCLTVIWILYAFLIYLYYKSNSYKWLVITVFLFLVNRYKYLLDNNSYVYYLDVGQGDCSLIIGPKHQEIIMIDTGGYLEYEVKTWQKKNKTFYISDNYLIFFKSLGINKIDLLVISHGDEDHAGEVLYLSNKIKIREVLINNYDNKLESLIRKKLSAISNYQSVSFDFNVLKTKKEKDENDDSLIIYFKIDSYNFLYMGDAPTKKELEIMNNYLIKNPIIKLGHHGSKTSSDKTFLNFISPLYAVISAGRKNRFNHPHPNTIKTLNDLNIKYFNTQTDGSILFKIKRNKLKIEIYSP